MAFVLHQSWDAAASRDRSSTGTSSTAILAPLLVAALLLGGCERRDMNRDMTGEEAIAAAEAHMDESPQWSDIKRAYGFRPVAYERRTTWLVKYVGGGGTGGPPTLELDKKSGEIVMGISGGQ